MHNPFRVLSQNVSAGKIKISSTHTQTAAINTTRNPQPSIQHSDSVFSEENIRRMFGHEAAEDEDDVRLKEYYFKNDIYEQVAADLRLRILVGHKGIGKSALFKIAASEDGDKGILPIEIQPNDVVGIGGDHEDFLRIIRDWDEGLKNIIADKIIKKFTIDNPKLHPASPLPTGALFSFILDTLKENTVITESKKAAFSNFNNNKRVNVYIDDLDRGWEGRKEDIRRISALLNAVRDLSNEMPNIHFKYPSVLMFISLFELQMNQLTKLVALLSGTHGIDIRFSRYLQKE